MSDLILMLNRSRLNREYTLMNALKALASIISIWLSPCNFLIEDCTEIFYAIYKWNVPSIQCKKRLRWSNSKREVDCPSLVFIDFHVPMLTPGRVGVFWEYKPSLRSVTWRRVSSAKRVRLIPIVWWYHLYTSCRVLGSGRNLVASLLSFHLA
jgi:hypothetical protein